jgi:hypothetical protein
MTHRLTFVFFLIFFIFFSCKEETEKHKNEILKDQKQKDLAFNEISKSWNFSKRILSPDSQKIENNWNDWRLFLAELYQKPKGTIGAFKRKSKSLVQKTESLNNAIPEKLDKPQIKSRLMAMITKVKSLNTYINIDPIPEKKLIEIINDLNMEVTAIQDQIEEIVARSNIKMEEGEKEMLNSIKVITPPTPVENDME